MHRDKHMAGARDQRSDRSGGVWPQQCVRQRQQERVCPRGLQISSSKQIRPGGWSLPLWGSDPHMVRAHRRIQGKEKCCTFVCFRGTVSDLVQQFVVCCRMILRESSYPRYLHSSVLLGGSLLIFGGNTHNDTSLSNGAKCFSADFLAYDIGLWCYFTACLIYTTMKSLKSVIFIKCFCKTFILLTKAAFTWWKHGTNNVVKYY